jgi:phosphoglycerate dehydrogenase-like enzyme
MNIWKNTKTIDEYISDLMPAVSPRMAEIALIGGKKINIEDFAVLKGIFKCGVGTDNIPFEEAEKRNIRIGFPSEKTADYIFEETACFACQLCLSMLYSEVGSIKEWEKYSRAYIGDKTLLVIGTGRIGARVSEKMRSFLQVKTFDICENSLSELPEKIKSADCITLHIPLNDKTRNFFGEKNLSYMKDGACLVNTARGAIVSEDALFAELNSKRIKAAFDVFWEEPYRGKLAKLPEDIFRMTPHIASTNKRFIKHTAIDFRNFIKGINND